MKVAIASDHAGFELKQHLLRTLLPIELEDFGPHTSERVDYPDFADQIVKRVLVTGEMGILVCGSGQGMAIRANRHPGIRAALCWDNVTAKLSREHNNANILCIGGRLIPFGLAEEIVQTFFESGFLGGRHAQRVDKLDTSLVK